MFDPTTSQMVNHLSIPDEPSGLQLGRRTFLGAVAAGVSVLSMPSWIQSFEAAAAPLNNNEGVLVLLTMAGGNDGLHTFVPLNNGAYRDARGSLALDASETIPFQSDRGFNKRLGFMKQAWDAGNLALIDGVGSPGNDLSHFSSMADWMRASTNRSVRNSGWLGRYVDGLPTSNNPSQDPFHSVSLSTSIPLVVKGNRRKAVGIPHRKTVLFKRDPEQPTSGRLHDSFAALGNSAAGASPFQQQTGETMARAVALSDRLSPIVEDPASEAEVVTKLRLAARLINANLGIKVISILFGDFDSHSDQMSMHGDRMNELDAGLRQFYETLNPQFDDQTLVLGVSEFGRRVKANGGAGTDHGNANTVFALSPQVKGGLYGVPPSFTDVDQWGNLNVHVDYRTVFANVLTTWFRADSSQIIGQDYEDLDFLVSPGEDSAESTEPTPGGEGDPPPPPPPSGSLVDTQRQIGRLYLAYFGRDPDADGWAHWHNQFRSGMPLHEISERFVVSREFRKTYGSLNDREFVRLCYQNILDREPDTKGWNEWAERLESGQTRGYVMLRFSESNEFKAKSASRLLLLEEQQQVGRLYWAYFLRKPDTQGLHHWMNSPLPIVEISTRFTQSNEFKRRYGTLNNEAFVDLVYNNVLGRKPDKDGRAHWLGQVRKGMSRGALMLRFANSNEFLGIIADRYGQ